MERKLIERNKSLRKMKKSSLQEKMITQYGNVKLEQEEKDFLQLGPDFALLGDIDMEQTQVDLLSAMTKVRWERMGKETEEVKLYREAEEIEEEEKVVDMVEEERKEFNILKKTVNVGYKRCTKMKSNRRIIFPAGRPAKEEAVLDVRYRMWYWKCRNTLTITQ